MKIDDLNNFPNPDDMFNDIMDSMNRLFGGMFGGDSNNVKVEIYDRNGNVVRHRKQEQPNWIRQNIPPKKKIDTLEYNENVLNDIFKYCKITNIKTVLNPSTYNQQENIKILKDNGCFYDEVLKFIEVYSVNLNKIKNINNFLEIIKKSLEQGILKI